MKKEIIFLIFLCSLVMSIYLLGSVQASSNLVSVSSGHWWADTTGEYAPVRNIIVNYTNTYGGSPSWQVPLSADDHAIDHDSIAVKPGDHLTFSCWIKTSAPTLEADIGNPQAGGRIGIDVYGRNGASYGISDSQGLGVEAHVANTFVKFGTSTWTHVTIDFVVRATYSANQETRGQPVGTVFEPVYVIPWLQTWSCSEGTNEHGVAWFAYPEFYISTTTQAQTNLIGNSYVVPFFTITAIFGSVYSFYMLMVGKKESLANAVRNLKWRIVQERKLEINLEHKH